MGLKNFIQNLGVSKKNKERTLKNYTELSQEDQEECPNHYSKLDQRTKKVELKRYSALVQNILSKKITLPVLKKISQLKEQEKKSFLEYAKNMASDSELHELNKKVMEHAIDLSAPEDNIFYLRASEEAIFRDLLYIEAKKNNFTAKIVKEGILTINFPSSIFQLYKLLVNNFYLKKFKNDEIRGKIDELYKKSLEDSNDTSEEALENYYVKQSLAQSIMCLLVSKYIKEHDLSEVLKLHIFKDKLDKSFEIGYPDDKDTGILVVNNILNDVNGIYISNLASSDILDSVIYSMLDNEISTVKISEDFETAV